MEGFEVGGRRCKQRKSLLATGSGFRRSWQPHKKGSTDAVVGGGGRRVEGPRAHAVLFLRFRLFEGWRRGENGVRVKKVLMAVLGLCREAVIRGWELYEGDRPRLGVRLGVKARRRGRCGRCGGLASFYEQGGGERRW